MRRLALALVLAARAGAADAWIDIRVDLSDQRMTVWQDGILLHQWPVSTARTGKVTPTGLFVPQVLVRDHRSSLYDGAPMPWSIFFSGNYAIHGTTQTDMLGTPASAGCVRLDPTDARTLFELVRAEGLDNVLIDIQP